MMRYYLGVFIFHFIILITPELEAQTQIRGLVVDSLKLSALPYTNITVKHRTQGTISNETGYFSLKTEGLLPTDTISFQYIGYKTRDITLAELDTFNYINLVEEVFNLAETFIFADPPEVEDIVEKIIENKAKNYKLKTSKSQIFVRTREQSDIQDIDIKLKRNSFPELNKRLLNVFEKHIPKHNISYMDFLGDLYQSSKPLDSLKLDPIKAVSLKSKDVSELSELESAFEKMFKNTGEKEYWKVKSGIISQKVSLDNDTTEADTSQKADDSRKMKYYKRSLRYDMLFADLSSRKQWDFLYKTKRYHYKLLAGTRVNGEDVYIIEFEPKKSGKFYGKMYVSIDTYALIRADYAFAEGKRGMHFQMFGVGYTVNDFTGSIYFEKRNDTYELKYFSHKTSNYFSFERPVALQKKRKRFLIDKELFEIKVKFEIAVQSESLVEFLVLNRESIAEPAYQNFTSPERIPVIYVDQFDDDLWEDYPIIEPTKQMRLYKKIDN